VESYTLKVLLIGLNPSEASPDNSPFHPDTKSRKVIDSWFEDVSCNMTFINILDEKLESNRALKRSELKSLIPQILLKLKNYKGYRFIALGKQVTELMKMTTLDFFEAPHPSGLNRKLNDKKYVADFIEEMKRYIEVDSEVK